jgi:hypothetical protein
MYLDTFLGSIGVEESVVKQIRASLDGLADDLSGMELGEAGGFGGSAAGSRMKQETAQAAAHITDAMKAMAGVLRDFGINLELWQDDMSYTDDDAGERIQALHRVQDTVAGTRLPGAPVEAVPAATGGA